MCALYFLASEFFWVSSRGNKKFPQNHTHAPLRVGFSHTHPWLWTIYQPLGVLADILGLARTPHTFAAPDWPNTRGFSPRGCRLRLSDCPTPMFSACARRCLRLRAPARGCRAAPSIVEGCSPAALARSICLGCRRRPRASSFSASPELDTRVPSPRWGLDPTFWAHGVFVW